jgi:minor extracellular serine protease Vpr
MLKFPAAIVAAVISASMMTHAQSVTSISEADNETIDRWFVELSSAPTIDGTGIAALEREEATFHAAAAAAGIRYRESRHFRDLFNGLTVRATGRDVAKLRSLPGVRAVYPDVKLTLSQQEVPPGNTADLITALAQTGADVAQSALGLTGRGVRVAVIDSGLDWEHLDLGGGFGPGTRVTKGFDFVGDAFNADDVEPIVVPDPDPDDCNGHGTHVSGIIGANGGLTGVAPGVTFHAYRVFGCEGTTTSDIMLEAMERAHRDGADVVNMSIGAALQWPQYPTAQAANRLVRRGIVVVSSAGNEGNLGLYASSAPGIGRDVIGVASFDNTAANLVGFSISPDDTLIGYSPAAGAPSPPTTGSLPMSKTGTPFVADDGCAVLPAGSHAGRAVLIRRGTCGFFQKALNAQNAGAAAVVLYNNAAGFVTPNVVGAPPITIPVVMITQGKGAIIDAGIAAGNVTLTWTSKLASEPNPTGDLISSFSSFGPAADLSFKPDLGAPGGIIRSTLPLEQGGYGPLSGTSMAAPHVAGAVALMLEARPDISPREVERRLQNTARPHLSLNPVLGFLDVVHRQGAGMLQVDDAITAEAIVSPSSLALGEIESASVTRMLRVKLSDEDRHGRSRGRGRGHGGHGGDDDDDDHEGVTYTLSHTPAFSTGSNTFVPAFIAAAATVTFNRPTVAVGRDHRGRGGDDDDGVSFVVTVTPPAQATGARLFGGYITLTPDDGTAVLRVPYMGYSGDYQAIRVLTLAGFPLLGRLTPNGFITQPGGGTFTMLGNDVPFILLHLNHQVANLKLEVFDANGNSVNFADDEDFLPRNQAVSGFFAVAWDGTTVKRQGGRVRTLPNGLYTMKLSILKALGDPRNPAHFETAVIADSITIARPAPTTP